jgi:nucleoside-diphosphate-sugar epimerase
VKHILAGETIDVFNIAHHARRFTHIDDVAKALLR